MMSTALLWVLHAGTLTTIQDLGRTGGRGFGVPVGGAFDLSSFRLANALVGNPANASALEMTLLGGLFEATCPLGLALTGARMLAEIEGSNGVIDRFEPPRSFVLKPGERLRLGGASLGARAYLAVRGGIPSNVVMGSRSWETPLSNGALVPMLAGSCPSRRPRPGSFESHEARGVEAPLRVIPGPDFMALSYGWEREVEFRVGPLSDRVGLRLEGPSFQEMGTVDPQRRSTPMAPGAIQRTPNGLIILGPASGTMGGYPHVAHLISADRDRVAQLRTGDQVRFTYVDLGEARRLDRDRNRFLRQRDLRVALLP